MTRRHQLGTATGRAASLAFPPAGRCGLERHLSVLLGEFSVQALPNESTMKISLASSVA